MAVAPPFVHNCLPKGKLLLFCLDMKTAKGLFVMQITVPSFAVLKHAAIIKQNPWRNYSFAIAPRCCVSVTPAVVHMATPLHMLHIIFQKTKTKKREYWALYFSSSNYPNKS
jgi:hypothetical protein